MKKRISLRIIAFFAIAIGLYPALYFITDMSSGLLSTKSPQLLRNGTWIIAFYAHIAIGGLALAIGWLQFSRRLRKKNIRLHRSTGKVYFTCVLISGLSSIYLSFNATGGIISTLGFFFLGVIWIASTFLALIEIKNGRKTQHQKFMTYSYAACFAAVTLRLWLPLLSEILGNFVAAYRISSWLCWVPNLLFAHYYIIPYSEKRQKRIKTS
ncbi:MAG: DUF2306 domain-containing protein [Psychroserpens sp.]|nr:DUF2306 domain-containing protein [Psychroserpens sp.]